MSAVHTTHRLSHPMRRLPGRPGVWVNRHGDWNRPLHVWLYRGAWRVICWPCLASVGSGDPMYDHGWPTQAAAMDAAHAHCAGCRATGAVTT